jgi:CheY-like chemotaxis protein
MDGRNHNSNAIVVIADDNRDAADTSAMLLQLAGHRVQVAYEGTRALELIRTLRPRVAILDLRMPQLDGYQVAEHVRREGLHEVRLIALTGLCRPVDRQRAMASGFDFFLLKPTDPSLLESYVKSSLAGFDVASWRTGSRSIAGP